MWQTMMAEPDTTVAEFKNQASVAAMAKMVGFDIKSKVSGQLPGCLNISGGHIVIAFGVVWLVEHIAASEQFDLVFVERGRILRKSL